MGPHRIIHNRKGYLTETEFDATRGIFTERPFPPPPAPPHIAAVPDRACTARLPDADALHPARANPDEPPPGRHA